MDFPIYRKHRSGKNFYKIISDSQFEELVVLGGRFIKYKHEVKNFLDRQLLNQLLEFHDDMYELMTEDAYNQFENKK